MKYMFVFVFACLALATAHLTEEQEAKMREYYEACVERTHVNKELIVKARGGDFKEDENLMKYYHCMMNKMGFQDEDGTLHPEVMVTKLPNTVDNDKGKAVIKKCTTDLPTETKEKTAYNIFKCFVDSVGTDMKFFN